MGHYTDLRELIGTLAERGLLHRIQRRMNKDTELIPLVRKKEGQAIDSGRGHCYNPAA